MTTSLRAGARFAVAGCTIVLSTIASAQTAGDASGQTLGASVALASLWDDETHLGRGPALGAEFTTPLGGHLRAGVEGGWFRHDRDAGYLAAEGHVLHLMGRASLLIGPRHWRTRPFVGAAAGVSRSTGTLTTTDPFAAPPNTSRRWTLTRPSWDVLVGVRARTSERWVVRPELRAGFVTGSDRGVLEPPLLRLQGGVAVEWALH